MRLGILSDTHDQLERTRVAVEMLHAAGAEVLIHCGDLSSPDIVAACAVLPLHFVFGNHDADSVPALREAARNHGANCLEWGGIIVLAGKRIGVVHGHMRSDIRPVTDAGVDYLVSGHFHATIDHRDGPTRWINPGALHRADEYTVALLDIDSDELQFLQVPS